MCARNIWWKLPLLYIALMVLMAPLIGCYSRCEAGHTICGGPYEPLPWLP
jgi:hypothetical protein